MSTRQASGLRSNSSQAHTPAFPQEIMNLIVEQLAVPNNIEHELATQNTIPLRPLLCSLRFISKSFNEAASRVLFRCMVSQSGPTHSSFLRTLIKNPRLAKHVRVYHTPMDDVRTGHVYSYVKTCLPLMTGLKELAYRRLSFSRQGGRQKPLPRHLPRLKTRKKPFQLKKFIWFSEQTRHEEDVHALEFLATQKDLDYLRWVSTRSLPSIYKDTIPRNIRFLDASVDVLVSILPERPEIKGIRLRMYNRLMFSHLDFAQVKTLAEALFHMKEFQDLSFISIVGDYEPQALQYLSGASVALQPFPKLAVLALDDIDFLRDIHLGGAFPKLKEVYFTKALPPERLSDISNKVERLLKTNMGIDRVNTREAASLPMGWYRFKEWERPLIIPTRSLVRSTSPPTWRTWEMSTDHMYSKILYVDSMRVLDPLWDASPL